MTDALRDDLWDSLAEEDVVLALTDEQREDLERRLAEADADPAGGLPWDEVRERIRHRTRLRCRFHDTTHLTNGGPLLCNADMRVLPGPVDE